MAKPVLHLASASPRRREILSTLGVAHSFAGADIDESAHDGESAQTLVTRLARQKVVAAREQQPEGLPILGADTVVVVDERIFGKPTNAAHAEAMLTALSARTHQVMTAVAVCSEGTIRSEISISEVSFRAVMPGEVEAYWQSGEPLDKAGAYAIQGYGGIFVQQLRGSYSGVVGLPVYETAALLNLAGISVLPELLQS